MDTAAATFVLDLASATVRNYCGWHIAPVTEPPGDTVTLDGPGGRVLPLPSLHVTGVSTVVNDGDTVTDYLVSAAGMLHRAAGWSEQFSGVVVTYTHGYTTPPVDVVAVVCSMAARAYASPSGVVREQVGPFAVTYSQTAFNQSGGVAFTATERAVLDRYRIPGEA